MWELLCGLPVLELLDEHRPTSFRQRHVSDTPTVPPSSADTLLVGRRLYDGSYAVAALNIGPAARNITCGALCFQQMGFAPGSSVKVRDLWLHADIATINTTTPYAIEVEGNGTSVLLKLSPL